VVPSSCREKKEVETAEYTKYTEEA